MEVGRKLRFCLLLTIAACLAMTSALQKRSDDVSPEALMTLIQQQAATIQRLEAKLSSTEAKLSSVEGKVVEHSSSIANLSSSLTVGLQHMGARMDTTVLFTAHVTKSPLPIGQKSPIRFDAVVTNVGGGYNPTTGVFTAPVSGVYVVYAQLMKQGKDPTMYWVLDKSGTVLCENTLEGADDYDTSSCLAPVTLQKGEQVFVRHETGSTLEINGSLRCSFSGFLVSRQP